MSGRTKDQIEGDTRHYDGALNIMTCCARMELWRPANNNTWVNIFNGNRINLVNILAAFSVRFSKNSFSDRPAERMGLSLGYQLEEGSENRGRDEVGEKKREKHSRGSFDFDFECQ